MKIILHTRTPVFDDKGGFTIHEPGEQLDLPKDVAAELVAKGAAAAVEPAPKAKADQA